MKPRAVIEAHAENVRSEARQTTVPVDPFVIAEHLGIRVVIKDFSEDVSGVLVRNGKSLTIALSSSDGPQRRRFTIAHECGHHVLEHKGTVFVDKQVINRRDGNSSLAIDEQEIEANQFAASLLMPREEIVKHLDRLCEKFKLRSVLVEMMAEQFRVSKPAMEFRLVNLGLIASPSDDF